MVLLRWRQEISIGQLTQVTLASWKKISPIEQMVNGQDTHVLAEIVVEETVRDDRHVVLWILHGQARCRTGTRDFHVDAGRCIILPAGTEHHFRTTGIVIPILLDAAAVRDLPTRPTVVTVGLGWTSWILHHLAASISPMHAVGYTGDRVLADLDAANLAEPAPSMPSTGAAAEVARGIDRCPADDRSVGDWASTCGVSAQTLRRDFLRQTGMSTTLWRSLWRLHVSREYLRAGYAVEWTAHQVGYASAHSFVRAFRKMYGVPPAKWTRIHSVGDSEDTGSERVLAARRDSRLVGALVSGTVSESASGSISGANSGASPSSYAPLPAVRAVERVHLRLHVVLWVYRGTATVVVEGSTCHLKEGEAVWMPAGYSHEVLVNQDSVALPVSISAEEFDVGIDDVVVVKVPAPLIPVMVRHTVATCTAFRPVNYDPGEVFGLFREFLTKRREMTLAMPTTPRALLAARAVLADLRDARSVDQWAGEVGVSGRSVNRWFRQETGRGFARWRTLARIQRATVLLDRGMPPVSVAHRVGYRHLSGFSRDFRSHLGMTPREYAGEP